MKWYISCCGGRVLILRGLASLLLLASEKVSQEFLELAMHGRREKTRPAFVPCRAVPCRAVPCRATSLPLHVSSLSCIITGHPATVYLVNLASFVTA